MGVLQQSEEGPEEPATAVPTDGYLAFATEMFLFHFVPGLPLVIHTGSFSRHLYQIHDLKSN